MICVKLPSSSTWYLPPPALLFCPVGIDSAELGRLVSVVSAALHGVVDIDPAALIGGIVISVSTLEGAVDIDLTLLDRGVRVALGPYRAVQDCQQRSGAEQERFESYGCHSDHPHQLKTLSARPVRPPRHAARTDRRLVAANAIQVLRRIVVVLSDFAVVHLACLKGSRRILLTCLHGAIKVPITILLHARMVDRIVLDGNAKARALARRIAGCDGGQ
jgi:hypothetical protein